MRMEASDEVTRAPRHRRRDDRSASTEAKNFNSATHPFFFFFLATLLRGALEHTAYIS